MTVKTDLVKALREAKDANELHQLGERFIREGYSAFYELQDYLKEAFKRYDEQSEAEYVRLLENAKLAVPSPGVISPSWTNLWDDLERMMETKRDIFRKVAKAERDGEWQVILDNPYSHENVACYPQLSFLEGAYLYSYFRLTLKKNEYVRLQKIDTHVMTFGE